ncbi:MAG: PcfB family protein [Oscillospiraceae bacterium]|nr:PcfB family protein [Oscillospiraceae bacterium]
MNVGGGEAADQMVRMMLSGTEVAVRLSGSALKNLLALTMALAHNRKTLSGKVNMGKMLRETRDLRRFPMTKQQYKQLKKLAKKHKLLYSVIRDKDDRGQLMDVILPVTELDRANAIFERILYTLPPEPERKPARELQQGREVFQPDRSAPERRAPEQVQVKRKERKVPEQEPEKKAVSAPEKGRQRQVKLQPEVSQRSAEQGRQEAPVTQRQEDKGKNGSRSERDSHVIKISSSTLNEQN